MHAVLFAGPFSSSLSLARQTKMQIDSPQGCCEFEVSPQVLFGEHLS